MKVLIIVLLILIIPLPLIFDLTYNGVSNLVLRIYGFTIKPFQPPEKKTKRKKQKIKTKSTSKINQIKFARKLLLAYQLSYYKPIVLIKLNSEYGFENPAITGISYGAINLILSQFLNLFNRFVHLKILKINIVPLWNEKKIEAKLNFFLIFNLLNIIIYIFILLYFLINSKKENYKKEG